MKMTSLCYLEKDGKYLMLHRTVKENDENHDKWIGIGGKFEYGESPEECAIREIYEETGLIVTSLNYRGIVTFLSNEWGCEYMHLFTSTSWIGELNSLCDEGELEFIDKDKLLSMNIWEGDKIFLKKIQTPSPFFSLKLVYNKDTLEVAILDGERIV